MDTILYSQQYSIVSKSIMIYNLVFSFLVLVYHLTIKCTKKNVKIDDSKNKETSQKLKIQQIVIYYILISGFLFCVVGPFHYFPWLGANRNKCWYAHLIGSVLYGTNKACVYYSYWLRLDITYNNVKRFGVNN